MTSARGSLQLILDGKGPVTLRPVDHIATGGQGSVYRISDMVVKVYTDQAKLRQEGLAEKFALLAKLKHPYIVSPIGLALAQDGKPAGYFMPFVEGPPAGEPLSRVFTNEFYQQRGFGLAQAHRLVERMRETFRFAHQHGAVLVDANELNWFCMMGKEPEPRAVDVDAWAIDRWKASVIMPSIRDWHSKEFNELTDWFAWGIVTFQIYTGIHPFKGTLDGFGRADLEARMKANASVFAPGCRLNRAVRDFACISAPLRNWYEAVFHRGERSVPPSPFDTTATQAPAAVVLRSVTTSSTGRLTFEKIFESAGTPVLKVFPAGLALLNSGWLADLRRKLPIEKAISANCEIVSIPNGWAMGDVDGGMIRLMHFDGRTRGYLKFSLQARRLFSGDNRLFAVTDTGITEIWIRMMIPDKIIAAPGQTWGVIANSTRWFEGLGVLDAMGATFLVIPFGQNSVATVRVRELDSMKVVAGKAGKQFAALVAVDRSGAYRKIELAFAHQYQSYKTWAGPADGPELNAAMLPRGVCATIAKDGELLIFVPSTGQLNRIEDRNIGTDMYLAAWEESVVYLHQGAVWSLRVTK